MKKIRVIVASLLTSATLLIGNPAYATEPVPALTPGPSGSLALGPICRIDTGIIYFRTSGNVYSNGAVGLKPLLACSTVVPQLSLSTTLYKRVWWGLQFQIGPVVTTGSYVQQVQTKTIEQQCLNRRATTVFYAIATSTILFPNGSTGGGNAFQENALDCATL